MFTAFYLFGSDRGIVGFTVLVGFSSIPDADKNNLWISYGSLSLRKLMTNQGIISQRIHTSLLA